MSVASDQLCTAQCDQVTCRQVVKTAQLRPAPVLQLQAQSIELTAARRRLEENKAALQQRADAVAAEESAARAAKKEMEASAAALQLREARAQEAEVSYPPVPASAAGQRLAKRCMQKTQSSVSAEPQIHHSEGPEMMCRVTA